MRNLITWSKKRAYGKPDDYLFTREECAWFTTKPRTFYKPLLTELRGYPGYNAKYPAKSPHKRRTNVWTDITEILRGKLHRCHKPEKLAQIMIETHTESGETILEPFAGSGSASVAAIRSGRRYVAIEKDSQTFECLLERLKVEENRR
jgi:DNA modification methylase